MDVELRLLDALEAAEAERDEAMRLLRCYMPKALKSGIVIHRLNERRLNPPRDMDFCDFCGLPWPCLTERARNFLASLDQPISAPGAPQEAP
jgi:hypothetical protein